MLETTLARKNESCDAGLRPTARRRFWPIAQVEGTLTGEAGLRCQLAHRPQRDGLLGQDRFTNALRCGYGRVTPWVDHASMRRVLAIAALATALLVPVASAGAGAGAPPPFPKLAGFTHAEINVRIRKQPHTLILDLGRVTAVEPAAVVLLESDGSIVTVPLAPTTLITLNGRPAIAAQLHKRLLVETMRIDGGAAVRVRAVGLR
jgi:hypothetical protein